MNPSRQPDQCPACTSETVEYWDDIESWLCTECSYVIGESGSGPIDVTDVDMNMDGSEDQIDTPWQEEVDITDNSEANLVDVLSLTEDLGETFSLPNQTTTRAAEIVTVAWERTFMHGRCMEDTAAAAFYAASRETERTIPPGPIAEEVGADKNAVKSTYQNLKSDQELDLDYPSPLDYTSYICDSLSLSPQVMETACSLLADNDSVAGNPIAVAGAGVYEATKIEGVDRSLREVASVTHLAKETIWRHAADIRPD